MTSRTFSRRSLLLNARWAPVALLPAGFRGSWSEAFPTGAALAPPKLRTAEMRAFPHYPSPSPLDDVLRLVTPGSDAYITEKYAMEISTALAQWASALKSKATGLGALSQLIHPTMEFNSPNSSSELAEPARSWIAVRNRLFLPNTSSGREPFLAELKTYFTDFAEIVTAEMQITSIAISSQKPLRVETEIRFWLVAAHGDKSREERIGTWRVQWAEESPGRWLATRWHFAQERTAKAASPLFVDVTRQAVGRVASYREQLVPGADHWRTVMDGASGIDVYGNNGIAAGDFDNDGFADLYIGQPAGLPNRLYRNRGDGTFEDVTEAAGVGVLDATACAILADFENRGLQDLLVVRASGPLLFRNLGNGKFSPKPDAFQFAAPPQGTFTHAAVADYDHDGRLDIYFCLYSYYLGLDQYRYPSPYFDARNGPPNFLFHNEGNGTFVDRTEAAGLNAENDRFSFACAWGDADGNGWPDLYVANDFGRSNLYRNRGDGTFEALSDAAGVNEPGAGMSACWADFQNGGKQDIYVSNMWSSAGQRVSQQEIFHSKDSKEIRALYHQHARGNSLYKNSASGKFKNNAVASKTELGRWAWSADAWDFDHDGYSDLYIANGYISGAERSDVGSFFWRQVVGNSPSDARSFLPYERGWNAINELIRSDATWNGYERNTFYLNNHDGTFAEISGIADLDFLDDSRSFALADLDHDGRLEVILKNRNTPQVRVLRNNMGEIGDAVCFRLRGTKSNRDAIGASITVQTGVLRQTKYLQAGSGFLSQHAKEVFFGLGRSPAPIAATVRWPSGEIQNFDSIPVNQRISITESQPAFQATPFRPTAPAYLEAVPITQPTPLPTVVETWLLAPLPAPDFSLADLSGKAQSLNSFRGRPLVLHFCSLKSPESAKQLKSLDRDRVAMNAKNLQLLYIDVDESPDPAEVREALRNQGVSLAVVIATSEIAGVYNILYRYLFDRRRDLPLPCSFLLDEDGMIVKVYQGEFYLRQFADDAASIPRTPLDRQRKGLPFAGTLHSGTFQRNDFTHGIALFQRGYLDQAAASFKQVAAAKPNEPEAFYNLGTLYLRKNQLSEARGYLEQTVQLQPNYPEAWNNLGMIAAQQNQPSDAIRNFQKSLALRPDYAVALLNLGNLYRRQGNMADAVALLNRALKLEPENAEANYSMGMLFAKQDDFPRAIELLQNAARIRSDYYEAWNNLGVLFIRESHNSEAEQAFRQCIAVAPNFDQAYLNLAHLYVLSNEKEKARGILQSLLRLQPQHKLAQQALEMLN